MGRFEAVLFDAGDTLIRLSGSGAKLLHEAAARWARPSTRRGRPGLAAGARPQ